MSSFSKPCPICNKTLEYKTKDNLRESIKNNSRCKSCANSRENHPLYGKKMSKEFCEKISERTKGENNPRYGIKLSEEQKNKISIANKGKTPINIAVRKGKTLEEIYGIEKALQIREKYAQRPKPTLESNERRRISCIKANCGKANIGRTRSDEVKRNLRIKMIEKLQKINCKFHPPYNHRACMYFNKIMEETGTFIQHAENGGEVHLGDLGYWLDGYDSVNNIVYEFDEKRHHYINGKLCEKDIKRQQEIINYLNCSFIRIREDEVHI